MIYFQSSRDARMHELGDDRPARKKDGTMGLLQDMPEAEDIEVYIETGWVPGFVRGKPSNYKFEVHCVSFETETEVWKALEGALRGFHGQQNSPIPWLRILPPSKQPGTP